jgi:hypothetical protein
MSGPDHTRKHEDGGELGATANAIILLGVLMGATDWRKLEAHYELLRIEPSTAFMRLRHRVTGNTYRVAVSQLDGME